jgi:hypothetical protein
MLAGYEGFVKKVFQKRRFSLISAIFSHHGASQRFLWLFYKVVCILLPGNILGEPV